MNKNDLITKIMLKRSFEGRMSNMAVRESVRGYRRKSVQELQKIFNRPIRYKAPHCVYCGHYMPPGGGVCAICDKGIKFKSRNPVGTNGTGLYRSFHGADPQRTRRVQVPDPPKKLIAIGVLKRIDYVPYGSSKRKGIQFFHHMGDHGGGERSNNTILATDERGENLYIIPTGKKPRFTERGIIG